jgi:hypothetical protein
VYVCVGVATSVIRGCVRVWVSPLLPHGEGCTLDAEAATAAQSNRRTRGVKLPCINTVHVHALAQHHSGNDCVETCRHIKYKRGSAFYTLSLQRKRRHDPVGRTLPNCWMTVCGSHVSLYSCTHGIKLCSAEVTESTLRKTGTDLDQYLLCMLTTSHISASPSYVCRR